MKVFVLCVFALALVADDANGLSDETKKIIQDHMKAISTECAKTFTLTEEDKTSLLSDKIPKTENAKCFAACIMKNSGIMNEAGMLSEEGVLALGKKLFDNAPEKIEHTKKFLEACLVVNTAEVSDGAKGCDRAKLIAECTKEHTIKMGLVI